MAYYGVADSTYDNRKDNQNASTEDFLPCYDSQGSQDSVKYIKLTKLN